MGYPPQPLHIKMASAYKKLTPREHVLQLPDTYVGSTDSQIKSEWVYDPEPNKVCLLKKEYNPAFYKLFDEIVVNAMDQVVRKAGHADKSKKVTRIDVTLTNRTITVRNDGEGIPVEMHPEYKVMVPELIFGHLLTSSNYDEKEEKIVGGRNGYGAKLVNIFSNEFIVRTCDGKQLYEQRFSSNMTVIDKPVVTTVKGTKAKPFTEISYTPDLTRFFKGCTEIPVDMLEILRTRVFSMAGLVGKHGCLTSLCGTLIPIASFESFVRLFVSEVEEIAGDAGGAGGKKKKPPMFYTSAGPYWEIVAIPTAALHTVTDTDELGDDRHISFVNNIYTRRGGKHVDTVIRAVLGAFCDGPGKKYDLTPAKLKNALTFFVNATIVNPAFDSQTKDTLTTPVKSFGSKIEIPDAFISKLAKEGGLLDAAQAASNQALLKEAKKTDGKCVARITGIPKLEDANLAGKAGCDHPETGCTLILTEGDSAKSLAMAGRQVVGSDRYGVYPLKGKSLNVRDKDQDTINANVEFGHIKKIAGLREGHEYKSLQGEGLRYSHIQVMSDQDVDGSHITGLIINMIHSGWPSLLRLGFIQRLITPLIKATKGKGKESVSFYSASEYEAAAASLKGWTIKYYKGLGTSTSLEAREYFKSNNLIRFVWDDKTNDSIDLVFSKSRADDRKEWLTTYDPKRVLEVPAGGADVTFTQFINDEMIHFSNASNIRAIPHIMDGNKPSQRKILWAARKRGLTQEIKVAQLVGYVSEHAAYHHGEAALTEAIIAMAQDFLGSNNINLFMPNGQFGTRLLGGKDAAASRYIFTALAPIQSTLFSKADDPALSWTEDDGQKVEPEYYLPVIPMLLVNGSTGIGTGFSTEIPPFNPQDLVTVLRQRLTGVVASLEDSDLVPWWDGFKGTVSVQEKLAKGVSTRTTTTTGVYQFLDGNRVRITELPVGMWTNTYKEFLEDQLVLSATATATATAVADNKSVASSTVKPKGKGKAKVPMLKSYDTDPTDSSVDFMLTLDPDYFEDAQASPEKFEKAFKLTTSFAQSNMVAFNCKGKLHRYSSVGEILEEFFIRRIEGYISRKANELSRLNAELVEIEARVRFVKAVVDGTLVVSNASDEQLLAGLKALGLPALTGGGGEDAADTLGGYEYLLRMRVDRLKAKSVVELETECRKVTAERDLLVSKTPEQLWLEDLDIFDEAYSRFLLARAESREASASVTLKEEAKGKGKGKGKGGVKRKAVPTKVSK